MKRIVILISGRGSNMCALVQACRDQSWPAQIVAVLSNRPDSAGLHWAHQQGVATGAVDHRAFPDRVSFDQALAVRIDELKPDLIVLAGFMRILGDEFVIRYQGRLLNIHPSLLPAFPGLHTHRAALAAGCKIAGATVHFVTPTLDHGPVVIQAAVPVLTGDDEQSLAQRVLAQEHLIYPLAVRWFVNGRLRIEEGRVIQLDGAPQYVLGAQSPGDNPADAPECPVGLDH